MAARRGLFGVLLAAGLCAALGAAAQDLGRSPILTIDPDRLFVDSARGQAVLQQLETESVALAAENRRIEAELIAEEQALTDERPNLAPDEFRALADAFDAKVQEIRTTQDAKTRELIQRRDEARQKFIADSFPVLAAILRERGAVILIDRENVFLSADAIDITDETIARIDSGFSEGQIVETPETPDEPEPAPEE